MFFNKKKREYTELQTAFLNALKDPDNKGNLKKCKDIAGYSASVPTSVVMASLKDEIIEIAKTILAENSVKAAIAIIEGVDDPISLGVRDRVSAAEKILDRVGIVKGERVEIDTAPNRIALLPARKVDDDEL